MVRSSSIRDNAVVLTGTCCIVSFPYSMQVLRAAAQRQRGPEMVGRGTSQVMILSTSEDQMGYVSLSCWTLVPNNM